MVIKDTHIISYEYLKKYIKKSNNYISGVMIHITNSCNLMCKHCYNKSGTNQKITNKIGVVSWLGFIKEALDSGIKFVEISGGEPLMVMDSLKAIIRLVSMYKDVRLQINTNGILLTDDFLQYLNNIKNEKIVQVSVDGHNPEIVGSLRGNKEIFSYIENSLRLIKKYEGVKLIVVHTVNGENKEHIDEFLEWINDFRPDIVVVGFILPIGRGENRYSDCYMKLDERLQIYKELIALKRRYNFNYELKIASPGGVFDLINYYRDTDLWMVVDDDGDIRYSCRIPYVLGNMQKNSFHDLSKKLIYNAKNDMLLRMMLKDIEEHSEFGYNKKEYF